MSVINILDCSHVNLFTVYNNEMDKRIYSLKEQLNTIFMITPKIIF